MVGHGNHATFWDTKLGKWDITFEANDMGHIKDIRKGEMTERMDELIVTTVGPRGEDREYYFTVRTDGDQKNIRMLIKSDNKDEDRRYLTNFAVQGKGLVPKKDVVPRVFKSITISDKNNMAQYVAREIRGMEQLAAAPVAKASEIKVQGEYLGAEWLLQGYGQLSLNGKEIEIRIPKKVGMNEDGEMRSERSRDFNSRIKVDVAVFDMYDRSGRNAGLLEGIKVKKGEAIDAVKITNTETNKTIYILGDRNGVYVRDRNGEDLATFDNSMRLKSGRLDDLDVKIIRIMDRKGEIAAEYRAQDIKIEEIARAGPKRERQTSVN